MTVTRLEQLKRQVDRLYLAKDPNRTDWADWLYVHHIFIVAENAQKLAEKYGGRAELAVAAAMLHDIADTVMHRNTAGHDLETMKIARNLLMECEFSEDEITVVVDDCIRYHGCHDGAIPKTLEGKLMATADAITHLQTDFYDYAKRELPKDMSIREMNIKATEKIERDFNQKIFFKEVREQVRLDYERVKKLFI